MRPEPELTPGLLFIKNEININYQLNIFLRKSEKKHLPKLVEVFREKKETLLVFELLDGDLTHSKLGLGDLPHLLEDVSRALASLHLRGFVHFDIRPENILYTSEDPFRGKVDCPAKSLATSKNNNYNQIKKWFKNIKLLEQFDFSKRPCGIERASKRSQNVPFRKQSPRKRLQRAKQLHSLMEKNYLGSFFQKQSAQPSSRNFFKLCDFGLSFQQSSARLVGFGDNEYLSPELLKPTRPNLQVNHLLVRAEANFQNDFTKCDIFSLGLTLVKFILAKVELGTSCARKLFKSAKSGNVDFLGNATFAKVNPLVKQILKEMLILDPCARISSFQILSMMKVAIPIISERELERARNSKQVGSFNLKTSHRLPRQNAPGLGKRDKPELDTPEVRHEMFYSKVQDSFSFPVLDKSTKAQNVSQSLGNSAELKRLKKGEQASKPSPIPNFLAKHNYPPKKGFFCKTDKDLKPTFAIRPKMHSDKFGFESSAPHPLRTWLGTPAGDWWASA